MTPLRNLPEGIRRLIRGVAFWDDHDPARDLLVGIQVEKVPWIELLMRNREDIILNKLTGRNDPVLEKTEWVPGVWIWMRREWEKKGA